jgi:hypothetical protein
MQIGMRTKKIKKVKNISTGISIFFFGLLKFGRAEKKKFFCRVNDV